MKNTVTLVQNDDKTWALFLSSVVDRYPTWATQQGVDINHMGPRMVSKFLRFFEADFGDTTVRVCHPTFGHNMSGDFPYDRTLVLFDNLPPWEKDE